MTFSPCGKARQRGQQRYATPLNATTKKKGGVRPGYVSPWANTTVITPRYHSPPIREIRRSDAMDRQTSPSRRNGTTEPDARTCEPERLLLSHQSKAKLHAYRHSPGLIIRQAPQCSGRCKPRLTKKRGKYATSPHQIMAQFFVKQPKRYNQAVRAVPAFAVRFEDVW